jgi:hypothetical protein
MSVADLSVLRWRAGRKVGRTIYAQPGDDPSDEDILIVVMDTPKLAHAVVAGHNAARRARLDCAAALIAEGEARHG